MKYLVNNRPEEAERKI